MKKWITLAYSLLTVANVFGQQDGETTSQNARAYKIDGGISGKYQGKVYLVEEEHMHGPQKRIDSCEVVNGRFQFIGEAPEHSVIHFIQSADGQLAPIFLEPGNIRTRIRADWFLGAQSEGTINNNLWNLHQLFTQYKKDSIRIAANADWMRFGPGTHQQQDSNFRARTYLQNHSKLEMEKGMVKYYREQAFAPFILLFEMTNELSLDELKGLRAQLDPRLNNHPYTKGLDEVIANKEFKVGCEAPAFSIRGMNGQEIELKDYAGKYILLDFWASWCGPCRREMPNVVKLYKECKGKNFEIVGISLDQKEADWKKAVKDLAMTWPQACDFLVWQGPVARKYNLSAVPYTVLINPEGKVEAIDLRGQQLINTVKSLLKKKK